MLGTGTRDAAAAKDHSKIPASGTCSRSDDISSEKCMTLSTRLTSHGTDAYTSVDGKDGVIIDTSVLRTWKIRCLDEYINILLASINYSYGLDDNNESIYTQPSSCTDDVGAAVAIGNAETTTPVDWDAEQLAELIVCDSPQLPKSSAEATGPTSDYQTPSRDPKKTTWAKDIEKDNKHGHKKSNRLTQTRKDLEAKYKSERRQTTAVMDRAYEVRPQLQPAENLMANEEDENYTAIVPSLTPSQIHTVLSADVKGVTRVRRLTGHSGNVTCVQFDQKRVISGSMDSVARVWDIRSGYCIAKLHGHKGGIRCLKFEKEKLYTGSWDMNIMVWDLVKFKPKAVLVGHHGSVTCLELNDRHLISGSDDGCVRVWATTDHSCLHTILCHQVAVSCLAVSDNLVLSGSVDRTVVVSSLQGEALLTYRQHSHPPSALRVEKSLVLSGDTGGQLHFWNKDTGDVMVVIQAHQKAVTSLRLYNRHFFTASGDNTVKQWDLETLSCIRILHGHRGPVRDVQASSDYIVTVSDDEMVWIHELFTPILGICNKSYEDTVASRRIDM